MLDEDITDRFVIAHTMGGEGEADEGVRCADPAGRSARWTSGFPMQHPGSPCSLLCVCVSLSPPLFFGQPRETEAEKPSRGGFGDEGPSLYFWVTWKGSRVRHPPATSQVRLDEDLIVDEEMAEKPRLVMPVRVLGSVAVKSPSQRPRPDDPLARGPQEAEDEDQIKGHHIDDPARSLQGLPDPVISATEGVAVKLGSHPPHVLHVHVYQFERGRHVPL